MGAVKKRIDKSVLRRLIPLRTLPEESFERLLNKTLIEEYSSGHQLFKQGDVNNEHIYLIGGKVVLNSEGKVSEIISSNDEEAKMPLAHDHPRKTTAVAKSKITIARVDSQLLGVLLSGNEKDAYAVADIKEEDSGDWMTMLLQSRAFENTPPATMQKIFVKLEPIEVKAGDVIVEQDSVGDYYYIIQNGRCKVTRKSPNSNEEITLAELGHGDTFGEEALIANGKRNATISMLTDGVIMRLFKDDFDELVKRPLLNWVERDKADQMIAEGGAWVDARMTSEYEKSHMPDSISIPLSMIRDRVVTLEGEKKYVVYCDTGKRSSVAAFLLSQRGFDAYVLDGGLNLADESVATSGEAAPPPVADKPAAAQQDASAQAAIEAQKQKNLEEQQRRQQAEEEVKRLKAEQQEAIKRAQAEAERFRKEAERAKKQAEEESKRLQAEREAARAEAEAVRQRLEEEQRNSAELAAAEVERIKAEAETAKKNARQAAERLKAEADVARQMAEKEAERLRQEQEAARQHAEQETARLKAEAEKIKQEAERVKAEAIASQRGREEEEAAKLKSAREAVRLEMEEELARLRAEAEEARLKTELEAQKNAEAELQKLKAEQEAANLKAEAEEARLMAEEAEAQAKADAEAVRLQAEQDIARMKSEAEAARIQAEEHAAQLMAEAQNTRLQEGAASGEMTEAAQLESEAKAAHMEAVEAERIKEQIEATRQAAEQEMRRMIAEAEETRKQAEKDAHRLINEAETMRMKAEEEVKRAQDAAENERKQALAESERLQNEVHNAEQRAQETIKKLEEDMAILTASAEAAGAGGTAAEEEDVIDADAVDEIASYISSSRGAGAGSKVTTLEDLISSSEPKPEPVPEPAAEAGGKKTGLMIGGGVAVVLVVIIGGWLAMSGGDKQPPATTSETEATPAVGTTAAPVVSTPETTKPETATPAAEPAATATAEAPAAAPAAKSFQDALKSGGKGPVMVTIPAAEYDMGSSGLSPNADERPRHTVTLKAFAISQYEITVAEFKRYLRATGKAVRSNIGKSDDLPAVNISWKDAVAYAAWLSKQSGKNYRLPTEAEWEYVATGGEDNAFFWWGIDVGSNNANCFDCNSKWGLSGPAPVGSFKANNYGVYDTAGNVREWVQDCYHGTYKGAPTDGSAWQESNCDMRVLRGGAFNKPSLQMIPAKRDKEAPDIRDDNTGFRIVLGD